MYRASQNKFCQCHSYPSLQWPCNVHSAHQPIDVVGLQHCTYKYPPTIQRLKRFETVRVLKCLKAWLINSCSKKLVDSFNMWYIAGVGRVTQRDNEDVSRRIFAASAQMKITKIFQLGKATLQEKTCQFLMFFMNNSTNFPESNNKNQQKRKQKAIKKGQFSYYL